jgi:hypothetical protein
MAVGVLIAYPYNQLLDDSGNPLAAGTIEIYAAGTSTPLPWYSDLALTTSLGTTITLDSAGRFSAYADPALSYKSITKNSLGATIRTQDNMRFASPTTAGDRDRFDILNRR